MQANDSGVSPLTSSPDRDGTPSPEVAQARWPFWGLIVAIAVFLVQAFYLRYYSIDDVAITYRYALHLAEGNGLNWNPGQPPVEGYSNFLWVLFLAGGRHLGFDIEVFAKVAGAGIGVATLALLFLLCRRLWAPRQYWWFPPLIVAACPVWVMWAMSGLELVSVSFFLVLIIFSLTTSPTWKIRLLSVGLCGLSLSRPEGIALAGLFLLFAFFGDRELPRSRRFAVYGVPALAVVICAAGLLVFRLSYFGYPVANTVYAKFSTSLPSLGKVGSWLFFGLPFLSAYVLLLCKSPTSRHRFVLGTALVLVIWQMLLVLPVSIVMYFLHRYQIAFLPLVVLAVPFALDRISQRGRSLAVVISVLVLVWAIQQWPAVKASYKAERFYYGRHQCVAERLARLPGRPLIALLDAGRIPYWSDLPAIDVWGLCNSYIARKGFSTDAVLREAPGPPDVYIMSVDTQGKDAIPRLGFDKLISADKFFQEEYKLWQVCPSDYYYGYAILLNVDWAARNGLGDMLSK